jgi:dCMP deaminase
MRRIMILYMPVFHVGYQKLFEKYEHRVDCLYVLGEDFIAEDPYIAREIRALRPEVSVQVIKALKLFPSVEILDRQRLFLLKKIREKMVIVTDDELSRSFAEKHFLGQQLIIETPFLRWDKKSVNLRKPVNSDRESSDQYDRKMMDLARKEGKRTSDWRREVGGILVRDGEIIMQAHNHHLPSEYTPYAVGDPRDVLTPGTQSELASAIHAEQAIIARAAREGMSLQGAHLYVNVFPCTICAKLIACSGISKVFFAAGHGSLDGDTVLRSRGVELVYVT